MFIQNFAVHYADCSTTKLQRHLKSKHRSESDKQIQESAEKSIKESASQKSMNDFVK